MYFCSKICSKKMQQILQHFFVVTCWVQDSYFSNTTAFNEKKLRSLKDYKKRRSYHGKNVEINMLITD